MKHSLRKERPTAHRKWTIASAVCGVLAALLWGWGVVLDVKQAAYAYLFAFAAVFTIVIGTLFLLMIGHACGAKWFVPLRRQCEVVVGALPVVCLGWFPLLFFLPELYPWTHHHALPPEIAHHVAKKLAWLNESFFVARSVGYLLVFVGFSEVLRFWSLRQDQEPDEASRIALHRKMVKTSIAGLIVSAFVLTFASWDWMMSLEPAWFSDMYGVYVFSGAFVAALGLWGATSAWGHLNGSLPDRVGANHFHAIGRLQLAMVIFWAYIGYAHVIQHWVANVPMEQLWYLRRWSGNWQWYGLGLIILHWFVPFVTLLFRAPKRKARTFLSISIYLSCVHLLDVYYLVVPAGYAQLVWSWMSAAAFLALSAAALAFATWRSRAEASTAAQDPLFRVGLNYESQS